MKFEQAEMEKNRAYYERDQVWEKTRHSIFYREKAQSSGNFTIGNHQTAFGCPGTGAAGTTADESGQSTGQPDEPRICERTASLRIAL